jgi:hypothetical protein
VVHGTPNLDRVPGRLCPLISWCLSKEASRRPSAAEFLAELVATYPGAADLTDWLPPRLRDAAAQRASSAYPGAEVFQPTRTSFAPVAPLTAPVPAPAAAAPVGYQAPQGYVSSGDDGGYGGSGAQDFSPWWPEQPADPRAGQQRYAPAGRPGRRRRRRGRVAVIAAVCGAVIAALVVTLGAAHTGAPPAGQSSGPGRSTAAPSPTATPTVGYLTLAQLRVGDCLTGTDLQLDTARPWPRLADAVPCGQRHTAEVFLADNRFWPESLAYPGSAQVVRAADAACNTAFLSYVGVSYAKSVYTWTNIIPDASTWPGGDRGLHCVAYYATAQDRAGAYLTGSIKGSRR